MKQCRILSFKVLPPQRVKQFPQNKDKKFHIGAKGIQSSQQKPLSFPSSGIISQTPYLRTLSCPKTPYQVSHSPFRQELGAALRNTQKPCKSGIDSFVALEESLNLELFPWVQWGGSATLPRGVLWVRNCREECTSSQALSA